MLDQSMIHILSLVWLQPKIHNKRKKWEDVHRLNAFVSTLGNDFKRYSTFLKDKFSFHCYSSSSLLKSHKYTKYQDYIKFIFRWILFRIVLKDTRKMKFTWICHSLVYQISNKVQFYRKWRCKYTFLLQQHVG